MVSPFKLCNVAKKLVHQSFHIFVCFKTENSLPLKRSSQRRTKIVRQIFHFKKLIKLAKLLLFNLQHIAGFYLKMVQLSDHHFGESNTNLDFSFVVFRLTTSLFDLLASNEGKKQPLNDMSGLVDTNCSCNVSS